MEAQRFDALVQALRPANRRSLLGGAIGGVLGIASLALGQDESSAARRHNGSSNNNRRRRRRRNRRRTWKLLASPLTYHNETPPGLGDKQATSACSAHIKIVRRRNRYRICGSFNYSTHAVANTAIDVRNVIIQTPDTGHSRSAQVTFLGWTGTNVHDAGCKAIPEDLARQILRSPWAYYVSILTNNPSHHFGAVAAPLVRQ